MLLASTPSLLLLSLFFFLHQSAELELFLDPPLTLEVKRFFLEELTLDTALTAIAKLTNIIATALMNSIYVGKRTKSEANTKIPPVYFSLYGGPLLKNSSSARNFLSGSKASLMRLKPLSAKSKISAGRPNTLETL